MEILGKEIEIMENEKLSSFEAICLMVILIINVVVLNIPNMIILISGSGSIINTIYTGIIAILSSLFISKLFNNFEGKDILDISQYLGGKVLKVFVSICFLAFISLLAIIAVKYLTRSIKIIYFNSSPIIYLLLFFIVPAVLMNKLGLRAVSGVNIVFIFIVIISLLFLLISSYANFNITKIFPVVGNGIDMVFLQGSTNIFAFVNIVFLFLIPSMIKQTSDFKKVALTSTLISFLILLFCITTFILTLPTVTESDEILSIYLLTRMIGFGDFLERLDAIFIFSWIVSLLSSLSIGIFYILRILGKMLNLQDEKALASPIGIIILSGCLFIKNYPQIKFLGEYGYRYGFIILVFGIGFSVLLLANLKSKKKL